MTAKMEVHGIEHCPVCVLEDVHTLAVPKSLPDVANILEFEELILGTCGPPPDEVRSDDERLPGVYIL